MKLVARKKHKLPRKKLANPFSNIDFKERLIKSNTVDLTNNCVFKDLGNGYAEVLPVDRKKKIK